MLRHRIPSQRLGPNDIAQNLLDEEFTTLEAITDGDALYLNSSSFVGRAQALATNASATMHAFGVAVGGAASGRLMSVRMEGLYTSGNYDFSGFLGRIGYVSAAAAGGVSTTPPAASGQIIQQLGFMVGRRTLLVSIGGAYQRGGALQ